MFCGDSRGEDGGGGRRGGVTQALRGLEVIFASFCPCNENNFM